MEETRKPVDNRWIVAGLIFAFLLLSGFGWFMSRKMTSLVAAPPAQPMTVEFADGGMLEIIGVSVGQRVVEINPKRVFSIPFFSSSGSSGGYCGGLNIQTEEEDKKVLRARLTADSPAAMFIEFRMRDADGVGMSFPTYLSQRDTVFEESRLRKSNVAVEFFNPANMDLETVREAMRRAGLEVLIQHHDPDSGWVNLMGPSLFHEPWPDRYITTLNAWRRSLPTLDFKAIRADGETVEFSLPNPDFRTTPTVTASPLPLPHVQKASDFTLTVSGVRRLASPGDHPFAAVDFKLEYTGNPVPGLMDGPIRLNWGSAPAADEWGNVVEFGPLSIGKQRMTGASIPLESKRMSLDLIVERGWDYPHSHYSGFMILDGKVSEDGRGIDFEPGPDAALLGVEKMPVARISQAPAHRQDDLTKDWSQLQLDVEVNGDQLDVIQKRIGPIQDCQFLIFIGDRDESSGLGFGGGGGGSGGNSRGGFHLSRDFTRLFPPGDLVPGTRVRVGLDGPLKNETIHLELELPATVEPE